MIVLLSIYIVINKVPQTNYLSRVIFIFGKFFFCAIFGQNFVSLSQCEQGMIFGCMKCCFCHTDSVQPTKWGNFDHKPIHLLKPLIKKKKIAPHSCLDLYFFSQIFKVTHFVYTWLTYVHLLQANLIVLVSVMSIFFLDI